MTEIEVSNLNFKKLHAIKILQKELKRDTFLFITFDELVKDLISERDSFCKQRDELINDMQNVKRKAEAFDEMVKIYNQKNDLPSDEIFMIMGYCISDLERGSDVESD